jgi:hypothetical protein
MDYDAYDALLHHIFRQVTKTLFDFRLLSHLFFRRKAMHGSSRPRRTSMQASAFVSKPGNIACSLMRTAS